MDASQLPNMDQSMKTQRIVQEHAAGEQQKRECKAKTNVLYGEIKKVMTERNDAMSGMVHKSLAIYTAKLDALDQKLVSKGSKKLAKRDINKFEAIWEKNFAKQETMLADLIDAKILPSMG